MAADSILTLYDSPATLSKTPLCSELTLEKADAIKSFASTSITVTEIEESPCTREAHPNDVSVAKDLSVVKFITPDLTKEVEHLRRSFVILDVLESHARHIVTTDPKGSTWIGKSKFLSHVYHYVRQEQCVQLMLPAFPCKSPNHVNKVLGPLPDLGEELALHRLDAMCSAIEMVHVPGAQVHIASDGVLFNDIIEVTDEDCWRYGEALKTLIIEKGFRNIKFVWCMNLLGLLSDENIDKDTYLMKADPCRNELERRFAPSEEKLASSIKTDVDTCLTYRGMIRFLESDMEDSPALASLSRSAKKREFGKRAKKMMQRSEAFTSAIRSLYPLHVRLSIHPSSGAMKLSVPLIPSTEGGFQKSPWHSCIVLDRKGRYRCVHSEEVRNSHTLIFRYGRPYFFQE